MSRRQLADYAAEQVAAAEWMLAGHRPHAHRCCACGQPLPCSNAESIARRRDHFARLLDPRLPRPVNGADSQAPAGAPAPTTDRRRP